mmetsp:Transcript_13960/g.20419  ORF Transcript_13960/g.20419 Transcript_13960/m.20419 type:complete len:218 (+) Transcript_13960:247-900(+)
MTLFVLKTLGPVCVWGGCMPAPAQEPQPTLSLGSLSFFSSSSLAHSSAATWSISSISSSSKAWLMSSCCLGFCCLGFLLGCSCPENLKRDSGSGTSSSLSLLVELCMNFMPRIPLFSKDSARSSSSSSELDPKVSAPSLLSLEVFMILCLSASFWAKSSFLLSLSFFAYLSTLCLNLDLVCLRVILSWMRSFSSLSLSSSSSRGTWFLSFCFFLILW